MKPRFFIFGLPILPVGTMSVNVYKNPDKNYGERIYENTNHELEVLQFVSDVDFKKSDKIVIQIIPGSPYIFEEYNVTLEFKGADVSHVVNLKRELNGSLTEAVVVAPFDKWRPDDDHRKGQALESQWISSKKISVVPLWESYFNESRIDYLEKFHKLWVGLNAFANHHSAEKNYRDKILSLVTSSLRQGFHKSLQGSNAVDFVKNWNEQQRATLSVRILQDEVRSNFPAIEFMELSKNAPYIFSKLKIDLDGLVFLDVNDRVGVYKDIYSRYNEYMASADGIIEEYDACDAFRPTKTPESVCRTGRLIWHNPFLQKNPGTLFGLYDFFGDNYYYSGQTDFKLRAWEQVDPLFFKYLRILYEFRCAYFHGDLPPHNQNNALAKAAYESLLDIYPSLL